MAKEYGADAILEFVLKAASKDLPKEEMEDSFKLVERDCDYYRHVKEQKKLEKE